MSGYLYLTFAPLWERFLRGEGALLAVSTAVVWLRGPFTRTGAVQLALSFLVLATLYSLNDLCDAWADGRNPKKNPRLVASFVAHADDFGLCLGAVQVGLALLAYALLGGTAALVVVALFALNVVYSVRLKGVPFVDVLAVGTWGGLYAAIAGPPVRLCVLVGVMTAIAHVFQVLEDRDVDAGNGIRTTAVASLPATTLVLALLCAALASLLGRELGSSWVATGFAPLALYLCLAPGAPAWFASRGCFGLMLVAVLGGLNVSWPARGGSPSASWRFVRPRRDGGWPCAALAPSSMPGTMTDLERFRRRLETAGAEVPADLLEVLFMVGGRLVTALDTLLVLDLGDAEPFVPARRLPDDAPR